MNRLLTFIIILMLLSCQNQPQQTTQKGQSLENPIEVNDNKFEFFVGTYTDGESEGIYKYTLLPSGELEKVGLMSKANNPSFLAKSSDSRFVVAVDEVDREGIGSVATFAIEGDSLRLISKSSSGGAHPCHVAINAEGYVLVANYTGGNVGLLKMNSEGILSDVLDVRQHEGKGITERQTSPHAHSAWFKPNSNQVIAVDLGTDELWLTQLDKDQRKLMLSEPQTLKITDGAGPRHLTFHPNGKWIYVVNELNGTVSQVEEDEHNQLKVVNVVSTLPEDYEGAISCADIHISSDGKFVYASNRGHDSIAIFSVNTESGSLTPIGHESVQGKWPRNFALSPNEQFLLVANQHTNNIVSFHRNAETGLLEYVGQIEAPTPVCILF